MLRCSSMEMWHHDVPHIVMLIYSYVGAWHSSTFIYVVKFNDICLNLLIYWLGDNLSMQVMNASYSHVLLPSHKFIPLVFIYVASGYVLFVLPCLLFCKYMFFFYISMRNATLIYKMSILKLWSFCSWNVLFLNCKIKGFIIWLNSMLYDIVKFQEQ